MQFNDIMLKCETLCVYSTSDADCNEQPTATADLLKTTDVDCNETKSDDAAVTENKVCRSLASSVCLSICILLTMEIPYDLQYFDIKPNLFVCGI